MGDEQEKGWNEKKPKKGRRSQGNYDIFFVKWFILIVSIIILKQKHELDR